MTEGQAEGSALGTEVFDAEVSARVAVMRAELERAEESMRTAVRFDLAKVCAPMLLCGRAGWMLLLTVRACAGSQLPPEIREMKASTFFDTYHGDIVEALKAAQSDTKQP